MAYTDSLYRTGTWVLDPMRHYAVTAWKNIPNVPGSFVLHDIMCWRETYQAAWDWKTGVGMMKLSSGEQGNSIVQLNEQAGYKIFIKETPFFSLLGHIEWRDVVVP